MIAATASANAHFRRPEVESGFSLVEVIVALALLAMITGLLATSMRGMRLVHVAMERSDKSNSVLTVQTYLRSLLASVAPAGGAIQGGSDPAFIGGETTLSFRSSHTSLGHPQGIYHVTISLQAGFGPRAAYDLVVDETLHRIPTPSGEPTAAPSRRSTLLTGIQAVTFAYYGRQDGFDEGQRWQSTWSAGDHLPRLVRIALRFPPGDPRTWGSVDLPLLLSGEDTLHCTGREPC